VALAYIASATQIQSGFMPDPVGSKFFPMLVGGVAFDALKPLGFIIPTALASGMVSFLIRRNIGTALLTGIGLSVGLFVLFKYVLDLGLVAFSKNLIG